MLLYKNWRIIGLDSELYKLKTMGLEKTFKIFFKSNSWSLASIWSMRYWKYNTVFIIYKTLKEINKTPIECSRKRRECILPGRGHFCSLWTDKFCDKAGKTSKKNLMLGQKWLCNKQILIRCHENWIFQSRHTEKTNFKVFKISSAFRQGTHHGFLRSYW